MRGRAVASILGALLAAGFAASPAWATSTPDAPAAPTLTSGDSQITLTFAPGASSDPIISNTATCTATGDAPRTSTGSSPLVVNGLTNGKTYSCHVASTNDGGTGAASPDSAIVAGLPDVPAQPTVAPGDTQLVVGFTPVNLNGSAPALVPYTAACVSSNGGIGAWASAAGSPITVTGVTNGKSYTCHVTAYNSVGAGPDSPESVPATPAAIPDTPAAPTISAGNNLMQVAFVPPADNGAPITRYDVTCTSTDGGATGSATGISSPINVSGLTNGNTYTCHLSATNSAGTSSNSDESDSALADAVPAPPSKPTVNAGPSRIVVSFVLGSGNGNQIQRTTATCTSSNGGARRGAFTQPEDLGESFSPITVVGVTNGKTYTCTVTATNDLGTGLPSPVSAAVVPRTAPGAPTKVSAVSGIAVGATGPLTVSFTAGATNGSPITSFRATCTDMRNGRKSTKAGTRSPITLTGLTTAHGFSCVAFDIGPGGTSVASAVAKVTLGAPGKPIVSKTVQKNRGLTLLLLAPSANGKPITEYIARCSSTNGGTLRGAASSGGQIVVKNMSLGASYTCAVTASNVRGAGAATTVGPLKITN